MSCPVYDIQNPTVMHIEMAEVLRLRSALTSIRDNRLSAAEARVIATHALQDGHTVAAPDGSAELAKLRWGVRHWRDGAEHRVDHRHGPSCAAAGQGAAVKVCGMPCGPGMRWQDRTPCVKAAAHPGKCEPAPWQECEACAGTGRYGFRDDDECSVCHGVGQRALVAGVVQDRPVDYQAAVDAGAHDEEGS